MADDEPATMEQIAEYESQLAGIVELLKESPDDESLLALKRDMEELLELSRASLAADPPTAEASAAVEPDESSKMPASTEELPLPPLPLPPPPPPPVADSATADASSSNFAEAAAFPSQSEPAAATATLSKKEKPHKAKKSKKKKVKDFVLPDRLIPNDEDTDAERKKKRRAAKALKNKWRLQKDEIESSNRQASWQSFQKKSSSSSSSSMFATKDGHNDRVGVVSKKQLTEFGARKRHK